MARKKQTEEQVARFADMFSALGTEPRLRIMRLLLSAHPEGMVVGGIINELEITPSTLSHHLGKLKNEDLMKVRRESTYLWYSANADALQKLLVSDNAPYQGSMKCPFQNHQVKIDPKPKPPKLSTSRMRN